MADVTTGQELNSYQGNAALADGPAGNYIGQAPFDITPLANYALAKYKTNLKNYETQEKDRAKVEEMFLDPNINVPLDEHLAEQIRPKMDEFKQTMAKNPSAYRDPASWYKIQQLDKELLADNARLKAVQVAKDKYSQLAGAEPNEKKKKNYLDHVAKLEKYKLGEQVPAFNEYFDFDAAHLPSLLTGKVKEQRMVGNKIETVERSVFNGIDALDKAKQQHIINGEVNNTGVDLAKTLLTHGGLEDLNKKLSKAYDDQMTLNFGLIKDKYDKEFAAYKKENPKASFFDFVDPWKLQEEVANIGNKLSYLKNGLQYITDGQEGNPELEHSFTYDKNGVRLNVDNDTLRAMYAILENPVGEQETVVDSKISKEAAEIRKLDSDRKSNEKKALAYVQGVKDKGRMINAKISKMKTDEEKNNYLSQNWDRTPLEQKEKIATIVQGKIFSAVPAGKSLPVYTIGEKGDVSILQPIGGKPVYDVVDDKGKPIPGKSKLKGWQGGTYKYEYVDPKTGESIEDQILADFEEIKKLHPNDPSINLDEFIKANIRDKNYDYIVRGENGTTDRKTNAAAQIKISNPVTGKDETGVFETENLENDQSY